MVTAPIFKDEFLPQAAAGGEAAAFTVTGAYGEATSNGVVNTYRARRDAAGWTDEQIAPPLAPVPFLASSFFEGFTPDLEEGVLLGGWEPPLTLEASPGTGNLYLRDNRDGSYRLLSSGAPADAGEIGFRVVGVSTGAEHVIFESPIPLMGPCGGPASESLCDWNAATGILARIGVKQSGETSTGAVAIAGPQWERPVSADGSRVFFHEAGGECGLCVRVDGADTRLVSAGGTFWGASENGSVAFLTSGGELERDEVETSELTPLTSGGEVQGVLGVAADGSRAYFVALGAIAPGAAPGSENLYLWSESQGVELIATGSAVGAFTGDYSREQPPTARVTPDGMDLAFTAAKGLVGLRNEGAPEIYLYSAATDRLACASCDPGGVPATTGATLEGASLNGRLSRNLSDDGDHLFFSSAEALAPGDANDLVDTYEYDASSDSLALVSNGRSEELPSSSLGSPFADASADGSNVFFVTRQQLVGVDRDEAADVYDARAGGGLASQNPAPPALPCAGDGCRGLSTPPNLPSAASASFVGPVSSRKGRSCAFYRHRADLLRRRAADLRRRARALERRSRAVDAKAARRLDRGGRRLKRSADRRDRRARRLAKRGRRCQEARQ